MKIIYNKGLLTNLMPQTPSGEGNTLTITIKLQKGIGT
jgi:hypothetical protein